MSCVEKPVLRDLYLEHASAVFGFLCNRVGRQEAEDLTSEVFLRVARALPNLEDQGVPIRAWSLRITRNLVIDRARAAARRPRTTYDPEPTTPDHGERAMDLFEGASALAALASLNDAQREVIDLRFLRDLTVAEVSVVLGISEDSVRALTYRAVKALRAEHRMRWGGNTSSE